MSLRTGSEAAAGVAPRCCNSHQLVAQHRGHVLQVLLEAALDLRQSLRVEVELMDVDGTLPQDKRAALPPPWQLGMKSGGEASLTLRSRWSFRAIASSSSSASGSKRTSMSRVAARHPRGTAVAPPVR